MNYLFNNKLVDRATFPFVGKWSRPEDDIEQDIYYYYVENKSYRLSITNRIERINATAIIGVYGYHQFAQHDTITLEDGTELKIVSGITEVKQQVNTRIIHIVKPQVIEQVLTLG